ncbi:arginase family protein [Seonamhaeicola sp. ML3]|uniref:arginase family protein n=1 Tax=Seonamhaeicola sp. ML3 TaxID=2937786 RepID=UPI0020104D92|nr:arginase family protein [Seonamhaeicola sp. ML3]
MDKLVLFNNTSKNKLLNKRTGETKFGQHAKTLTSISNIYEQLKNLDVQYVIFGIPNGVKKTKSSANTKFSSTWEAALDAILNIQNNKYIKAKEVLILGHLDFNSEINLISNLNPIKKNKQKKTRDLIEKMDSYVSNLVYQIVASGKKPIIIGGNRCHAYGNIKGSALALNSAVNAINLNAQPSFKPKENNSINCGFSNAFAEGFLDRCFFFGLHENYTAEKTLDTINKVKAIKYNTFENIEIRKDLELNSEMERALKHVSKTAFGIEIDCNAIKDLPNSAVTPSGFSVNQARTLVSYFGNHDNAQYLHISEVSTKKKTAKHVGNFITYLITDFIKA